MVRWGLLRAKYKRALAMTWRSKPEMNKDTTKILIVFFYAMIQLFDMTLIQEPQHFFLELPTAFAWDDLNQIDFSVNRFLHNAIQFFFDHIAFVVNLM